MKVKLYADIDEEGNIICSIAGCAIVPGRTFDHFFECDSWEIPQEIENYQVVNGQLQRREEPEEEPEEEQPPIEEEEEPSDPIND
ncbi:hypothetical protein [Desmospora activa]|uniref:Uncharacterized protein n=1 Tax=Desmospora activa DSM 45169 TaxID=1121389 RepID=A0A2T4Z931_9BACL|nr:hypothetical protein [Desmospora activa]PTM58389.1 hypothetical protein C8J48_0971 [Desmospora activa DSM 45169]